MNFGTYFAGPAVLLSAVIYFGSSASAADSHLALPAQEVCRAAAAGEERARALPDALLQALSVAESGRRDEHTRRLVAWPWTVMAEGAGRYYPTKEHAVAAVRELQARGVRNIDVGCMQINLMHHGDAFESIEAALDPAANVAYGADYLRALHRETRSWFTAVKRYHSAKPKFHLPYRGRVFRIWRNIKRRSLAARELMEEIQARSSDSESMSVDIALTPANTRAIGRPAFTETSIYRDLAFAKAQDALAAYANRMTTLQLR